MKRRYRIRMNGNGEFLVQRRFGLTRWLMGYRRWVSLSRGPFEAMEWDEFGDGTVFPTSESACKFLLEAQEMDTREERARQWSTVVEDNVKG